MCKCVLNFLNLDGRNGMVSKKNVIDFNVKSFIKIIYNFLDIVDYCNGDDFVSSIKCVKFFIWVSLVELDDDDEIICLD